MRIGQQALVLLIAAGTWPFAAAAMEALPVPLASPAQGVTETAAPDAEQLMQQAEAAAEDRSPEAQRQAAELFERAAADWIESGNLAAAARAFGQAGASWRRAGNPDTAIRAQERAAELAQSIGDSELVVGTYDAIGFLHYLAGRRQESLTALSAALAAARDAGDRNLEAEALNHMAAVHTSWGQHQKALELFRDAVEIHRVLETDAGLQLNLNNLAREYVLLGEPERAIRLLEEALPIARRLREEDAHAEYAVRGTLGWAYEALGDLDKAAESYSEALAVVRELSNSDPFVNLVRLADVRLRQHRAEEAEILAKEVGVLARESPIAWRRVQALLLLGRVDAGLGRPDAALTSFAEARRLAEEMDRQEEVVEAERRAAEMLLRLGRLADARHKIEAAIEIREGISAKLVSERLRASARSVSRHLYDLWLEILARLHEADPGAEHDRHAFVASERARARSLQELFAGEGESGEVEPAADLLERRQRLDAETRDLQRRIRERTAADGSPDRIAGLESRLEVLAERRRRLDEALRRAAHDAEALLRLEPVPLAAIQAVLPAEAALLEYFVGDEGVFAFAVTRQALRLHRLDTDAEEVDALAARLRTSLERPSGRGLDTFVETGRRLYELLLAPVESDLAGRELLLVAPDGPLHYLPFEVLPSGYGGGSGFADLPYLLQRHAVAYVPSGSALALLAQRGQPRGAADRFLVVADPEYGTAASEEASEERGLALRSVFGPDRSWSPRPLPFARREAAGLVELAGADRVTILAGADATEERLKAHPALHRASALHFATHALVSEREPTYSGLVLALEEGGEEDGLLQVYEVAELDLAADLVVLSACETGLGRAVRGEGLVGLTQAFLAAGANSLVVSLWPVADASTAELMLAFYEDLRAPAEKAAALRQAKLHLLASERYSHPYYWAPFILQGTP